ncbi:MAG: YdbH domain-containing protein [Novosphingobium sp.]|nr:YdbH domain-containing protein [Novosphingobium sp.]
MASDVSDDPIEQDVSVDPPESGSGRSRWRFVLLGIFVLLVLALAIGWFSRERIAHNLIASELKKRGVPATYRIESIGPRQQVLANLVIGDPKQPDFTAERLIVAIRPRFGVPEITSVRVIKPRLHGTWLKGKLSFGALDPLIFTQSDEPFRLPDMNLAIEDGRGLIESDHGALGLKLEGNGNLRGGFAGQVAAVSTDASFGGCDADRLTLFGKILVTAEKPDFTGPVRLSSLKCANAGLGIANLDLQADVTGDAAMNGAEGKLVLKAGSLRLADYAMRGAGGISRFSWRNDKLTARYDLAGRAIETPQLRIPKAKLAGRVRSFDHFSRVDVESDLSGSVVALGAPFARTLDDLARQADGSFVTALAQKAGAALRREAMGANFAVSANLRHSPQGDSLIVPGAVLRGASGQSLVSLSRLQVKMTDKGPQLLAGNFATGGPNLPRISGTVSRQGMDGFAADIAMAAYASGDARLVLPKLVIVQKPGRLGFAGRLLASGELASGARAENLSLPIEGNWSQLAGLSVWRSCTQVSFERLRLSGLDLSKRSLSLCPPRGGAIVRSGAGGLKIAAGTPSLDLAGKLGGTPVRLKSGPVGLAWPGHFAVRTIDVALGPAQTASRFRVANLTGLVGSEIGGAFDGAEVSLDAVPLDMTEVSGRWRYAGEVLTLAQGRLRLSDREQVDRFEPLVANDATLRLADNLITASAVLREPESQREVLRTDIRHNLASGRGSADLFVDGLLLDDAVQPDTLTPLALGVIANAKGTVRGTGRIDWDEAGVTSTGRFGTDGLDFAAAFGPVTGASGTIEFTDLLGLVTAPDQQLKVAAINPGIEVTDGTITYELREGNILAVKRGRWPFLEGALRLRPVDIEIGTDHAVRYVLVIDGIDAARFVQQLDLGNLAATGTFDGRLPLIFDKDGGRIERGRLTSREPGGNVSYVGELTYKDLSPMANYAFDALRSIDYKHMAIQMDGPLDGEIITRVVFDGISQGEGASRNFVTKRIAKLPIRFRLNIRAPFMQLVSSMRSLYDPEYVLDPRVLGITKDGKATAPAPKTVNPGKPDVQPSESGGMP